MTEAKRWNVEIFIDEHDGKTRAEARLQNRDRTGLVGVGQSRCNPTDKDVPEIGDELAVSRALYDLAHKVFDAATQDVGAIAHHPVWLSP